MNKNSRATSPGWKGLSVPDVVSSEIAVALKELGYPQDGVQMRYQRYQSGRVVLGIRLEHEGTRPKKLAAPSTLQALAFLEERYCYQWGRSCMPNVSPKWCAHAGSTFQGRGFWRDNIEEADTPLALLEAVTARLLDSNKSSS